MLFAAAVWGLVAAFSAAQTDAQDASATGPLNYKLNLLWDSPDLDLDLSVLHTGNCTTNYAGDCTGVELDLDSIWTEVSNETIVWSAEAKQSSSYLVYVQSQSNQPGEFVSSKAQISLKGLDETEKVEGSIPTEDSNTLSKYWVLGCFNASAGLNSFQTLNILLEEKPTTSVCSSNASSKSDEDAPNFTFITLSGADNNPIPGVNVTYNYGENNLTTVTTDDSGKAGIKLPDGVTVKVIGSLSGYIDSTRDLLVDLKSSPSLTLSLMPEQKHDGKDFYYKMVLTWGPKPKDLDLIALQFGTEKPECLTNYLSKDECDGIILDLDNMNGGDKGAETITWTKQHDEYNYLLYVESQGYVSGEFLSSQAQITMYGPNKNKVSGTIPTKDPNLEAKYWALGCLNASAGLDKIQLLDVLMEEAPTSSLCTFDTVGPPTESIVASTTESTPETTTNASISGKDYAIIPDIPSEEGEVPNFTFITLSGADNKPIPGVQVAYNYGDETIVVTTDDDGKAEVNLPDQSTVNVTGSLKGYMNSSNDVLVNLESSSTLTLSLMPEQTGSQDFLYKMVLTWGFKPKDLDLIALRIIGDEPNCTINFMEKECDGVVLDLDNMDGGDKGAETITWTKDKDDFRYLLYVESQAINVTDFVASQAHITLYGPKGGEKRGSIPTEDPSGVAKYWALGCFDASVGLDSFKDLSVLLEEEPEEDICEFKK